MCPTPRIGTLSSTPLAGGSEVCAASRNRTSASGFGDRRSTTELKPLGVPFASPGPRALVTRFAPCGVFVGAPTPVHLLSALGRTLDPLIAPLCCGIGWGVCVARSFAAPMPGIEGERASLVLRLTRACTFCGRRWCVPVTRAGGGEGRRLCVVWFRAACETKCCGYGKAPVHCWPGLLSVISYASAYQKVAT